MMNQQNSTMSNYLGHLFSSMRRNPGESARALLFVITTSVLYGWIGAMLLERNGGGRDVLSGLLGSLLPVIVAMILLQLVVAAWRLNRNQQVSLATKQALLDLQEEDIAGLSRQLAQLRAARKD